MSELRIYSSYGMDPSPRIEADGTKSWPEPDDIVEFTGCNGTDYDQKHAREWLEVGKCYEVDQVRVGGWQTTVFLKGIAHGFNSVMFKVVTP